MLRRLPLLLPFLLFAAATPLSATAPRVFQDTAALDRAVAAFAGKAVGEEGGARTPVDPRLKLAACPMVSMAWRSDAHDAVVVTCTGPEWRMFVPIKLSTPAPKGPAPLVITPNDAVPLKPVYVIKRGDPVTISAGSPGFTIMRDGVATGDAVAGARFLVKVDEAKAPIQAVAIATGRATLPGWIE